MVVAKKRENFEHIFVLNWAPERTQRTNSRWQQKNYFTRFLNNFNIIVTYSKLYCSSNQLLSATKPSIRELEESKSREFYADVVWLSHTCMICRFTITSCWKTIYQELKKVKVCDWSIMEKVYQGFVVAWYCSSKFAFMDRRSSNSECPNRQGCDKDWHWTN